MAQTITRFIIDIEHDIEDDDTPLHLHIHHNSRVVIANNNGETYDISNFSVFGQFIGDYEPTDYIPEGAVTSTTGGFPSEN